ncbi:hypothetical protein FDP41_002185 [Naegleria fowleri]|uniref:Uncharacterized protein n=1 Tax=Naegleria fowleri TaxID=5763 RepID=A0A6A5BBF7_NAEFO|nr:uncharacterized protein FDP41_010150 [Naegleria fowleri]XP_044563828.1 uncharacterized protein FDP41_002185 [Naegleria fowleri]KAF0971544.1 hypothetical protein FDP41_010150 [Naegleria fowleri]KAF0979115.1 hypothetical protein FDP41_002185 [Naegleria fowleri]CAG4719622.1 unnamed protein product [Naegleria fowleri]
MSDQEVIPSESKDQSAKVTTAKIQSEEEQKEQIDASQKHLQNEKDTLDLFKSFLDEKDSKWIMESLKQKDPLVQVLSELKPEERIRYFVKFALSQNELYHSQVSKSDRDDQYNEWKSDVGDTNLLENLHHKNSKVARSLGEIVFKEDHTNLITLMNKLSNKPVIFIWKHKKIPWFKYVDQAEYIWKTTVERVQRAHGEKLLEDRESVLLEFAIQMSSGPSDWEIEICQEYDQKDEHLDLNVEQSVYKFKKDSVFPNGLNIDSVGALL